MTEVFFYVRNSRVPELIGRKGRQAHAMKQRYDCFISYENGNDRTRPVCRVHLVGNDEEKVRECRKEIARIAGGELPAPVEDVIPSTLAGMYFKYDCEGGAWVSSSTAQHAVPSSQDAGSEICVPS